MMDISFERVLYHALYTYVYISIRTIENGVRITDVDFACVLGVKSFLATPRQSCEFVVLGTSSSMQLICCIVLRTMSGVRFSFWSFVLFKKVQLKKLF